MDANKTIDVSLVKDTSDTDGDGINNHDELVLHQSDPNDANDFPSFKLSKEDTENGAIAADEIYLIGSTAELPHGAVILLVGVVIFQAQKTHTCNHGWG